MTSRFGMLLQPVRTIFRNSTTPITNQLCLRMSISSHSESIQTQLPISDVHVPKLVKPDKLYRQLEIELKGNDPAVLKSYAFLASSAANHLNVVTGKSWALRKANHNRFVLLKSVHIYKKHRVHYEIRTYFRFMQFHKLTGSTLATFLEYIERNLPEGVAMKTTNVEVQTVPEHLLESPKPVN